jgi:RNA polymerase sigma-70 factor (sigma-E family)
MNTDEDFTAFVKASGTQLERTAFLLAGDRHLAEDLVQSTYVKVLKSWGRVRDSPAAYARATLLNTFISQRRLRRSSEVPTDLSSHDATARPHGDPTSRIDTLNALATLQGLDRAVVILRYWEDRSVASTAEDLGISESAVRTRARRALTKLRPLLSSTTGPTT